MNVSLIIILISVLSLTATGIIVYFIVKSKDNNTVTKNEFNESATVLNNVNSKSLSNDCNIECTGENTILNINNCECECIGNWVQSKELYTRRPEEQLYCSVCLCDDGKICDKNKKCK